jgi:hypothetical protein
MKMGGKETNNCNGVHFVAKSRFQEVGLLSMLEGKCTFESSHIPSPLLDTIAL